jgi:hypothetical protein
VEKALAGKRLGKMQALLMDEMLAEVRAMKETGQAEAQPVSPAPACKPEQHFPELDRQPETCRIYTMPKNKVKREKKQRRGRPEIPGRRVVVKLEEAHIKRASELGEGNVAAGIRQALAR